MEGEPARKATWGKRLGYQRFLVATAMWFRFAQDNNDADFKAGDAGLKGVKQNVSLTC